MRCVSNDSPGDDAVNSAELDEVEEDENDEEDEEPKENTADGSAQLSSALPLPLGLLAAPVLRASSRVMAGFESAARDGCAAALECSSAA